MPKQVKVPDTPLAALYVTLRIKCRFLPEEGSAAKPGEGADRFELAAPEVAAPVTYGLSTRGGTKEQSQGEKEEEGSETRAERPSRGHRKIASGRDWETEQFKEDVAALPDVASLEAYEAMPVEAFGEAMLRGMGWSETLPEQVNSGHARASGACG